MKVSNKSKQPLAWYYVTGVAIIFLIVYVLVGGIVGALSYLAACVILLISVAEAARHGFFGKKEDSKPSVMHRIVSAFIVLVINFIVIGIFASMVN